MGKLLDDYKSELLSRQGTPGFNKDAFRDEFLVSRGYPARKPGIGLPKSRALVPDVAAGAVRGLGRAAEGYLRTIKQFDPEGGEDIVRNIATKGIEGIQGLIDKYPSLQPSKEAEAGLRRALVEGTESFVQSAATVLPGLAISSAVPVAAPFIGGAISGTVFGLSEKDRFEQEVEEFIAEKGLTGAEADSIREKGRSGAIKSALTEGGLEAASNALEILTLGIFKPFKGAAKGAVKTTFKSLFQKPGSAAVRAAKEFGKVAGTEVSTEMAQEALETKFRRDLGLTDASSMEAAMSVIAPTLVTSLLFMGAGGGVNALDRRKIKNAIQDAGADPAKRKKAVDVALGVFGKKDKDRVDALRSSAYSYIDSGAPIDLSTEFGVLEYAGQIAKDLNSGAIDVKDVEKFAEGISVDNQLVGEELKKIASYYRIKNEIPELREVAPHAEPEDLSDVILNTNKDVDLGEELKATREPIEEPATEVTPSGKKVRPFVPERITIGPEQEQESGPVVRPFVPRKVTPEELVATEEVPEEVPVGQAKLDADRAELAGQKDALDEMLADIDRKAAARDEAERQAIPETTEVPEPTGEVTAEKPITEVSPIEEKQIPEQADKPVISPGETPEIATKKIDVAAEQTDENPTEAQIDAGNAKKGHINVQGLDISIETAKGQQRSGTDLSGKPWSVTMKSHYGYIKGTKGKDKEHLDSFIGSNPGSDKVFVVNQINPETGKFDEHKVMIGFDTEEAAKSGYLENYNDGWKGLKSIVPLSIGQFKDWISGDTTKELIPADIKAEPPPKVVPVTKVKKPGISAIEKEIEIMSDDDIEALLDAAIKEVVKQPVVEKGTATKGIPSEGPMRPAPVPQRTASDIISDAAKSGVKGIDSALKGLHELFGGGALKSIPGGIDKDTYAKAKPHFQNSFNEFVNTGKSLKEFFQFMVQKFSPKIKPYLKQFIIEQRKGMPVTKTGEKGVSVTDVSEPTKPVKPKEEKIEKPKRVKLKDVGEEMYGKRSQKNNFERIKEEIKEMESGNANKDLAALINRTQKQKLWPIESIDRPNATPGLIRYLKMIRNSAKSATLYTSDKLGGISEASKDKLERYVLIEVKPGDRKGYTEVANYIAKYENSIEALAAVTQSATSIREAYDNILRLVTRDGFIDKVHKAFKENRKVPNAMFELSEEGFGIMDVFLWKSRPQIFDINKLIEDEHAVKVEPKQLKRTSVSIEEILRENFSEHRQGNPDPSPKDFQDTFGFRGVEFGEYVDSQSGRRHINLAYDSYYDLIDTLGIRNVKAASVTKGDTSLGMAFGSRGRGRHKAHYEPSNHVINMTRDNGDGSLSHEWSHALDSALSSTSDGLSAVNDLKDALNVKYNIEAAKAKVEEILSGNSTWSRSLGKTPLESAKKFLRTNWEQTVIVPTDFTNESGILGDYWNDSDEKFARAFESFVYDSMTGSNPYLVNEWVSGTVTTKDNGYRGNPYPQGEEREQFNRMFRHFIDGIQWSIDGVPSMRSDYVFVSKAERQIAEDELKKLYDALEDMYKALHQGKPSKDGLWWYGYTVTKRAAMMQPKDFNAYDDKYSDSGAVGYTEALLPDDILYYKLKDIVHDEDENKVYLKEKIDAGEQKPGGILDTSGLEGEASLGEAQAEDGEEAKTGPGIPVRIVERPGEDIERRGEFGEGRGAGTPRLGEDITDVDPITSGKGIPGIKPGSDAVLGGGNYGITESDRVGKGSLNEKFTNNISAIRTLKDIESEGRLATREEQAVLVKYSGWGGMPSAFDKYASGWRDKYEILREALTDKEYAEARASTLNSFYTSPEVVRPMYTALQRMGFKGGRMLEPALGTGNFFGLIPSSLSGSTQLIGVELDGITVRIARQLYQRSTVFHGAYEDINLPRGFYDVALSNVPFGETIPFDRKYNKSRYLIHDYFFVKTLELVRPGGIIGFITTAGTLDKAGTAARKVMAEKADFIGAIRLPDTAFQDAGTKVTADIIFLRKKGGDGKALPNTPFTDTKLFTQGQPDPNSLFIPGGTTMEKFSINEYFHDHPEMMLGKMSTGGRWGKAQVLISDGRNIEQSLNEAIEKLPGDIYAEAKSTTEINIADLIPEPEDVVDGSYYEKGDKLYSHVPGQGAIEIPEKTSIQKRKAQVIRAFIKIRGIRRKLLKSQAKDESEALIKKYTKELNHEYDAFVKKFGFLNVARNMKSFIDDPEAARVLALENWNDELGTATKSDIFSKRFIQNLRPVTKVDTASDAIPHSLNTFGRIDLPYISKLTGLSEPQIILELDGEIWNDPEQGWVITDEYLSGDIKKKIALAEQASLTDASFKKNIAALTPLIPPDLPPSKITANLGAPWIDPVDVQLFIRELIPGAFGMHVDYVHELGRWSIRPRGNSDAAAQRMADNAKESVAASATWGTSRKNFFELLDNILNGGMPVVRDAVPGTQPTVYVLNTRETDAAQSKYEAIKERFSKWIWENDNRLEKYVRKYNDVYNSVRQRKYDGSHLTLPGKVPDDIIKLTPHQKNAIWRAISSGLNTYFAHEVGTGKTFVLAATVMEAKRLGLKKKPLVLGINTNVDELAENFVKLYPAARVLRIDISQKALKRRIQLNRIANNDWDAVIIGHDSFKNLQLSPEGQAEAMEEELGNLRLSLDLANSSGSARFTVKQIEGAIKSLEEKQKKLLESLDKDRTELNFEELGVDMIVVDEAHAFKNIPYSTRHSNVVGISGSGSSKAFDLYMKTRWINEKYGGGVILASGTPITNSVAEIFNIGRYLSPQLLRDKGIHTFDAWAAAFGNITQTPEFSPEGGKYRMVRKFKEFVNIPELRSIVRSVVDVVSVKDIKIKTPDILHGKPVTIVIPQNEMVSAHLQEMMIRARNIRSGGINHQPRNPESIDIMLSVINDGRNAAIDMRLVDPELPDHPDTKVNKAIHNIYQSWKASESIKGTQLVFIDRGVPGPGKKFDVYHDMRAKLIKLGIPASQIAFPRDVKKNKLKKRKLFNKVNAGEIRIVIGSTADMGVGVNMQERGVAIHNMDTEWTFEKLEQRRGRFIRQGNILEEMGIPVAIFNYATKGTVDAFMWDKVAAKKLTTEVVLFGDSDTRIVEDVSQEGMNAQETMALASGDPRFLYKITLEAEVRKLNAARGNWIDEQYLIKKELASIPGVISAMETGIAHRKRGLELYEAVNAIKIGDTIYDLKRHSKELGERMNGILSISNVKMIAESRDNIPIATFGNAITKEVKGEETTTVKTAVEGKPQEKTHKVLQWNGNEIPVYIRGSRFTTGEFMSKTADDLRIGTKTQYGEFEMVATGGFARLLSNTKLAMQRQSDEANDIISKKLEQKNDLEERVGLPFDKEELHTAKTLELAELTKELNVISQEIENRGAISPDLERFKSKTKAIDVGNLDVPETGIALSVGKKAEIKAKEKEYWSVTNRIGYAVISGDVALKEKLEKERTRIQDELSRLNDTPSKLSIEGKRKVSGVTAELYNDLFNEAERILGTGKVDVEITTQEELKKSEAVISAAERQGIPREEFIEHYNVKGAYQGVIVNGVATRGVIRIAIDGVSNIGEMDTVLRHEVFHGVFRGLLSNNDKAIIMSKYKTEEKAADAFADFVSKKKLFPVSIRRIFEKLLNFFERLGNLLRDRGFRSAGDIFGAAASGQLIDNKRTDDNAGEDVSLSIEKGVPEENLSDRQQDARSDFNKFLLKTDSLSRQYVDGLRNVVTQNPANVILNKTHSAIVNEINKGVTNRDIKLSERIFGLPWFLAKKYKEWNTALGIELKRGEERNLLITEFNKKVKRPLQEERDLHEIMALSKHDEEGVLLAIYEGDARNVEFSNEDLSKEIKMSVLGDVDPKYKGKSVKLNQSQIDAYKAWHSSMKSMRDRVIEAIRKLTYLRYEDKPWVAKLKAVVERHELQRDRQRKVEVEQGKITAYSELSESEIPKGMNPADRQEFVNAFNSLLPKQMKISALRRKMGKVKGYAPRVRRGRYAVKAYDVDKNTIWHDRVEKESEMKGIISNTIKTLEARGLVYGKDFTVEKEISDKASEFIFSQVKAVSVERFVNKALARAKTKETISNDDIDAVAEEMILLLTDEFKQRGFSARMMGRAKGFPIGGYKIDSIKRRYAEYISGASGYITKQVAAFEYANLLRTIDVDAKPDLYEDLATYSSDMLRNQTALDRISGRARSAAFIWYLAGQFKSPMVNFTQNWILGIPLLEKTIGKGAKGMYHRAMYDVARRRYSPEEKQFIEEMQGRGITGDQLTREITGQTVTEAGKIYEPVIKTLGMFFSLSEIYNRKVSALAMFRAARENGEDYRTAFDKSRKFVIDVHFLYGKLNAPSGARGGTPAAALVRTSLTFRNYTFNFMHTMKDLLSERDFRTVAKAMTYMVLLGGASALPFLDGFLDVLERNTGISWRKKVRKELENVGGEILANVGIQGLPALVGADIGGSLRIHFPDVTQPGKLIEESVFGVYGGLALKAVNSVRAAMSGQLVRAFEIAAPTFIERPIKAIRESSEGLTTIRGKAIKEPTGKDIKPDKWETVLTGLGFRPSRIARLSDQYRQYGNIKKFYSDWRDDIYTAFRLSKGSKDDRKMVFDAILQYNKSAASEKGAVPQIGLSQLKRAMRESKDKRYEAYNR